MMMRPQQINVFDVNSTALSDSGIYDFDGSGSIKAMGGARRYRYDGVSRMVESQETWGATTYIQRPTFDGYGNIQSMETGPSGSLTTLNTPTNAATNRFGLAPLLWTPKIAQDRAGGVWWRSGGGSTRNSFVRMRFGWRRSWAI